MPGHFNTRDNEDGGFASTKASDHVGFFGSNEAISPPSGGGAGGAGVFGLSTSPGAAGVFGANNSAGGVGVQGDGVDKGVSGFSRQGTGVRGITQSSANIGVFGSNDAFAPPEGDGAAGAGVFGLSISPGAAGVFGANNSNRGVGVQGNGPTAGVRGFSQFGNAIHGTGGTFAGFFEGGVKIQGGSLDVTKVGEIGGEISAESIFAKNKHFIIDHPCDPENKYLLHASVESSEMMNLYSGVAVCDDGGGAAIELPDWFEALNTDFRYQLTCIGRFSPVYVAEKIRGNRFTIAGGQPQSEVSWQVVGVRRDAWALEHPLVLVRNKSLDAHRSASALRGSGEEVDVPAVAADSLAFAAGRSV
jgi:hypothetical protein